MKRGVLLFGLALLLLVSVVSGQDSEQPTCKKWMCAPSVPPATIPCYDQACVDKYVKQYGGFCECVEPAAAPRRAPPTQPPVVGDMCCCQYSGVQGKPEREWWKKDVCTGRKGRCLPGITQRRCMTPPSPARIGESCCCQHAMGGTTERNWWLTSVCKGRQGRCLPGITEARCVTRPLVRPTARPLARPTIEYCCCQTAPDKLVWMSVEACKIRGPCMRGFTRDTCVYTPPRPTGQIPEQGARYIPPSVLRGFNPQPEPPGMPVAIGQ
jgi:hypothetical protein